MGLVVFGHARLFRPFVFLQHPHCQPQLCLAVVTWNPNIIWDWLSTTTRELYLACYLVYIMSRSKEAFIHFLRVFMRNWMQSNPPIHFPSPSHKTLYHVNVLRIIINSRKYLFFQVTWFFFYGQQEERKKEITRKGCKLEDDDGANIRPQLNSLVFG